MRCLGFKAKSAEKNAGIKHIRASPKGVRRMDASNNERPFATTAAQSWIIRAVPNGRPGKRPFAVLYFAAGAGHNLKGAYGRALSCAEPGDNIMRSTK